MGTINMTGFTFRFVTEARQEVYYVTIKLRVS